MPAIRETREEADVSQRKSAVRQIVEAMFEKELANHPAIAGFHTEMARLARIFDDATKDDVVADLEREITNKLEEMFRAGGIGAKLQFDAPSLSADLAANTRLLIRDGTVITKPEHQGHGAQRSLVLALLQLLVKHKQSHDSARRRPILLLVEEPEIYMHPEMCRRMRDTLLRIARSGTAQVVCTTHSPTFLDLADRHDGIAILRRINGNVHKTQREDDIFHGETASQQRRRLRMMLNFDPTANEVFFTNEVCLVEGDSEVAAVSAIAERLYQEKQIDINVCLSHRRRVAIVNCRGKWTITAFQHVLNAFNIAYRVVHDEDAVNNDENIAPEGSAARANRVILDYINNDKTRLLKHQPNFERQIFGEQWKKSWNKDKPFRITQMIQDMPEISADLLRFFEFVLNKKVSELRAAPRHSTRTSPAPSVSIIKLRLPERRNYRSRLERIDFRTRKFNRACAFGQFVEIAAGPGRVIELSSDGYLASARDGHTEFFAHVRGDSMADTLVRGDMVVLRKKDFLLGRTVDNMLPAEAFLGNIRNGGVYAIAINEHIEMASYTLKRVQVSRLTDGRWLCEISADNPEAEWGDRGTVVIHRHDSIHFAAELVGLVDAESADGALAAMSGEQEYQWTE
ncbi:AAA family ATPase [Sorangium sp. So ce1036]|uniref:AAA family ATPase n=1 Tax=Sorangium sp. So ce1036 TaxID=3133328 RepID=UPI003F523633